MSIRKQLFLSNIRLILFALGMMLLALFVTGGVLRVRYDNEWQGMKNLDERVYEVMQLLRETENRERVQQFEKLAGQCEAYEYVIHVRKDGVVIYSELAGTERKAVDALDLERLKTENGSLRVAQSRNRTVVYDSYEAGNSEYEVLAVGRDSSLQVSRRELVEMIVSTAVVVLLFFIVIILLLSMSFSARMIDRFLVPITKLTDAAKRVEEGNLEELIYYSGDNEFSMMCNAFNEMQESLKREIERNLMYEKAWVEMVAGISHDLRTPLTSVKGYMKGMLDGVANTPEKQKQYVQIAYEKACDMDQLLQQLFLLSKLETGNIPIELQRVCMDRYLQTILKKNEMDWSARGAVIRYQCYAKRALTDLDTCQMERVLTNIIQNSLFYKPGEQIAISISLYQVGSELMLSIVDDGNGVPEESLPYLFESFYRIPQENRGFIEGSGLGLSIVKYIVEAHGGHLKARNRGGLELLIYLPCRGMEPEEERKTEDEADSDSRG